MTVTEIEFKVRRWDSYSSRLKETPFGERHRRGWVSPVCGLQSQPSPAVKQLVSASRSVLPVFCFVSLLLTRGSQGASGAGWSVLVLGYE